MKNLMKRIYLITAIILGTSLFSTMLYAQSTDNEVILGNKAEEGQLKIRVRPEGKFDVLRYSGGWKHQVWDSTTTHLFSIKIGTTTFSSGGTEPAKSGGTITNAGPLTKFDSIHDIGTAVTAGTHHEMTKKFMGTYDNNSFSVTIKITYTTNVPEFFIKNAIIDATDIPLGTPISFAYGFDTYLAANDKGYAFIVPDLFGLNNNTAPTDKFLTKEEVQSLRLVGARNSLSGNAIIAYFPIGRDFDRAWSANPFKNGYSYNILALSPTNTGDTRFKFQFGPYNSTSAPDNGQGVGYDDVPAGEITEIKTGLTFSSSLDGELNFFWNEEQQYIANIGETVELDLHYSSFSKLTLYNVGFRVDFPGLHILETGCTTSGFNNGTVNCNAGDDFFQITEAEIFPLGKANFSIPVKITQAGQWIIQASSISNMTQVFPLGAPTILTVPTTVNLTDGTDSRISKGETKTYTIRFPEEITAAQDVTIHLAYFGDMDAFSNLPASVTIPAGENSVSFQITAPLTSESNSTIIITLSSTDQEFATIVEPFTTMLTIEYEPVEVEFCQGKMITFVANPTNGGDAPSYQWKKNNIDIQGETNFKFTYLPQIGDVITCEMTSNATCLFPITVLSPKMILVPCRKAWVSGTVFPFNHYGEVEFDTLFHVVASLYDIELLSQGPEAILEATPLFTDTAVYYNGSTFIPNTPKYPGYLGRTSNPGSPINWGEIRTPSQERDNTFLLENEKPESNIGLYSFDNILQGEYILVLTKEGYFPRFAKININAENYLIEHRELVPGYFDENFTVDENTLAKILENIARYDRDIPGYNPKYDINGDLKVDMTDISILKFYLGFHWLLYEDTFECFEQP